MPSLRHAVMLVECLHKRFECYLYYITDTFGDSRISYVHNQATIATECLQSCTVARPDFDASIATHSLSESGHLKLMSDYDTCTTNHCASDTLSWSREYSTSGWGTSSICPVTHAHAHAHTHTQHSTRTHTHAHTQHTRTHKHRNILSTVAHCGHFLVLHGSGKS